VGPGVALIVGGSLIALGCVFLAWRRLPPAVSLAILAVCGEAVGAGALLVQDRASDAEWAITLVAFGALVPLHARLVFSRPNRPR
jgi:hypothetical protein